MKAPSAPKPSTAENKLAKKQLNLTEEQIDEAKKAREIASRERVDEVRKGLQGDTDWLVRMFGARSSLGGNIRPPQFG